MSYSSLPNPWSRTIPLVRPLLGVWREEIIEYLHRQGQQPLLDRSNLEVRFYRNRLRHELIPQLEALNPGARRRIWNMAAVLQDEDGTMEQVVETAWSQCRTVDMDGRVAFSISSLLSQPKSLQRRLIRRAIARLRPGLRDIDYATVERGLAFLAVHTCGDNAKFQPAAHHRRRFSRHSRPGWFGNFPETKTKRLDTETWLTPKLSLYADER